MSKDVRKPTHAAAQVGEPPPAAPTEEVAVPGQFGDGTDFDAIRRDGFTASAVRLMNEQERRRLVNALASLLIADAERRAREGT